MDTIRVGGGRKELKLSGGGALMAVVGAKCIQFQNSINHQLYFIKRVKSFVWPYGKRGLEWTAEGAALQQWQQMRATDEEELHILIDKKGRLLLRALNYINISTIA